MAKLVLVAALALVAGCKKSSLEDNIIAEYTKMKDNLCACTAKDCADRAKAQADAIEQRARQDVKQPSRDVEQKFEKIESQINECARKFE